MHVNLEKRTLSSCCSASSVPIDREWLNNNPGKLFNHQSLVEDRQKMLDNKPCASCETACWSQEAQGLDSRRTRLQRTQKTHVEIYTKPETINLHLGSTCNMSCAYCGPHSSSSWVNDVKLNGDYGIDEERARLTDKDILISKLGQKAVVNSTPYTELLDEIKTYKNATSLDLTGGEPFLYNNIEQLISGFSGSIRIQSGLGVDSNRLTRMLDLLPLGRTTLTISAENIDKFYEFNRYGNTYKRFLNNLEIIRSRNIKFTFRPTLSNLTVFGFSDFLEYFKNEEIHPLPCTDPKYLKMHLIDTASKQKICDTDYGPFTDFIHKAVKLDVEENDRLTLKKFLFEYSSRRKLDLGLFPKSFVEWLSV